MLGGEVVIFRRRVKGQLRGSYGLSDSPPVQDKGKVLFIVLVVSKVNYGKNQ